MAVKASAFITISSVVDVSAVTRYYLLQSSTLNAPSRPTDNPPTGGWSDTEPGYTGGSTNTLYFTDMTVFSDGSRCYSAVSVSSSYEAAKEAYNRAVSAQTAVDAAQSAAEEAGEMTARNAATIRALTESVDGFMTNVNQVSNAIQLTVEDHDRILSAMEFSETGLKIQMDGSIYYTLTDDTGYHIFQNNKEIAAFSEGKGKMDRLLMGSIVCRKTGKGGWVWNEVTTDADNARA